MHGVRHTAEVHQPCVGGGSEHTSSLESTSIERVSSHSQLDRKMAILPILQMRKERPGKVK